MANFIVQRMSGCFWRFRLLLVPGWLLVAALAAEPAPLPIEPESANAVPAEPIRIFGSCRERSGEPSRETQIRLYRTDPRRHSCELLRTVSSNERGAFDLGEWPDLEGAFSATGASYLGVACKSGFASMPFVVTPDEKGRAQVPIVLAAAGTLRGTVTDSQGKPVAQARVYAFPEDLDGMRCAITDTQGHYEITDAMPLQAEYFQDGAKLRPLARFPLHVSHPEHGTKSVWYWECPGTIDLRFDEPAIVEGRVVGRDGKPAPDIAVWLQATTSESLDAPPASAVAALTDAEGRYRLLAQGVDVANLFVWDDRYTARAIEGIEPVASQTTVVPDLRLVDGGFVAGKVFDKTTGRPVVLQPGERLFISAHSPARPRSGAAVDSALVQPDGSFRLRLPEGTCCPYFAGFTTRREADWAVVSGPTGAPDKLREMEVKEGTTTQLDFTLRIRGN